MQRWRVPLGFVCAALFFVLSRPRLPTLAIGGVIAVMGLGLRGWASGYLRKNDELATSGPYARTRNPLYLGSFVIGLGFSVAAGRWYLGILFLALFLGIYLPVMRIESQTLAQLFGESFARYSQAVPMFLPRLTPYRDEEMRRVTFDPGLYRRYREYRAALGLIVAWAVLAFKAIYFN
jgi:protein-S-isoprenylcysteine O-methyltransferase Ste14